LISVPNSCSIRYLQEVCTTNALTLTPANITQKTTTNPQHFVGKHRRHDDQLAKALLPNNKQKSMDLVTIGAYRLKRSS